MFRLFIQKWSEQSQNSVHSIRALLQFRAKDLCFEAEDYNIFKILLVNIKKYNALYQN